MKNMRARLASLFVNRSPKWDGNITAVWDRCHGHLQPLETRLPLPGGTFVVCPLCQESLALRVRAHVRFGPDRWMDNSSVLHCSGCKQYSLTQEEISGYVAEATQWAKVHRSEVSPAEYAQVTAVNARLWARNPTVLNIEPTTRCNFSCWYCIGRHMKQDDIDFDGFVAALDNFPTLKILALVGEGEPLMHKQFFDMVKVAKERGIRVVTLSNGSPFSESVVKKLCESEVDYISISIDSTDPATFAESRIDGDLVRVWEGIKKLTSYRDSNGYKYPLIGVKGSLFDHTRTEMPAIVSAAKQCGVDMVESFQALNPKRSYVEIYPADKLHLLKKSQEVAENIAADYSKLSLPSIVEFAEREGMAISNCGPGNGLRANCNEEWIYSLLSGDVTPCCQIKDPMDKDWNIFTNSIDDIQNNHHYENVRFNLWNGVFLSACDGCSKTLPH